MTLHITPDNKLHDDAGGFALKLPSWPKDARPATAEEIESLTSPATPAAPTVVDMRQARLALLGAGLLGNIDAALAALPSPDKEAAQIEWEFSPVVKRDSPLVQMLSSSLGLDEAALDALFIAAGNL